MHACKLYPYELLQKLCRQIFKIGEVATNISHRQWGRHLPLKAHRSEIHKNSLSQKSGTQDFVMLKH